MESPTAADGYPRNGVVSDDWSEDRGPLDLMSSAGRLGALVWTERQLHRVVGSWAVDAEGPDAVVLFDRLAMAHAHRADVLFARLPNLRELPTDVVVVAPGPVTEGLVGRLSELTADPERLAAWADVGRELVAAYEDLLRRSSPVADAPLRRRLPAVVDGLSGDLDEVDRSAGPTDGVAELVAATASFTA